MRFEIYIKQTRFGKMKMANIKSRLQVRLQSKEIPLRYSIEISKYSDISGKQRQLLFCKTLRKHYDEAH